MSEPDVLVALRRIAPDLPGALRRVADEVLADPPGVVRGTIVELADRSGTSASTVTRLAQYLGFAGYPALRVAVAASASVGGAWDERIRREFTADTELAEVARGLAAAQARAVRETLAALDLSALDAAAAAVAGARRVDVFGVSGSAIMAAELRMRLHGIGVPAWVSADVHEGLTAAALQTTGDVTVGISHRGGTRETLDVLRRAHERGATTVAVTGFPDAPIGRLADHVLTTVSQQTTFRDGPLAARHSELTVVEMLYVAVAQRTYDRTVRTMRATADAVRTHLEDA
ncbi:MurR/RpiR family transcriptional regulator [Actinocatenispora rupis]|uniref:MurR/RpiR family transcriptional regulator n=1 Tax=Actinocatenispora rupis TaxID=519421 RepID=UPI0019446CCE|nr:MurR/RpiR family transcriptional regulator [Actinocatenispora rupis]